MAQYIGARYVPAFYEGTDGNNWESNITYESLTIVTYLRNTYTSKKLVPASIGNPADNPDYWALTGRYSEQIEDFAEQLDEMGDRIDTVEATVGGYDEIIGEIQATSEQLNGKVSTLEGTVQAQTTAISGLQTSVTSLTGNVSSLSTSVNTLSGRVNVVEGSVSDLAEDVGTAQNDIIALQEEIGHITVGDSGVGNIYGNNSWKQLVNKPKEWEHVATQEEYVDIFENADHEDISGHKVVVSGVLADGVSVVYKDAVNDDVVINVNTVTTLPSVMGGVYVHFSALGTYEVDNLMLFDLTSMYGAGKEPANYTAFKNVFSLDYYPCSNAMKYVGEPQQLAVYMMTNETVNGVTFSNQKDKINVSGTATGGVNYEFHNVPFKVINGHKMLLCGCPKGNGIDYSVSAVDEDSTDVAIDTGDGAMFVADGSKSITLFINVNNTSTEYNLDFVPQLYDLTEMFGKGNEPQTLEDFRKVYVKRWYAPHSKYGIVLWKNANDALMFAEVTLHIAPFIEKVRIVTRGNLPNPYYFNKDLDFNLLPYSVGLHYFTETTPDGYFRAINWNANDGSFLIRSAGHTTTFSSSTYNDRMVPSEIITY